MELEAPGIDQVVGRNVQRIRQERGLSQVELGIALGGVLEKPWHGQSVSLAERGRRPYGVNDLLALAWVLEVRVTDLLAPTGDSNLVDLGSRSVTMTEVDQRAGGLTGAVDERDAAVLDQARELHARVQASAAALVADVKAAAALERALGKRISA